MLKSVAQNCVYICLFHTHLCNVDIAGDWCPHGFESYIRQVKYLSVVGMYRYRSMRSLLPLHIFHRKYRTGGAVASWYLENSLLPFDVTRDRSKRCFVFVCKFNIWNVNYVRPTAIIFFSTDGWMLSRNSRRFGDKTSHPKGDTKCYWDQNYFLWCALRCWLLWYNCVCIFVSCVWVDIK